LVEVLQMRTESAAAHLDADQLDAIKRIVKRAGLKDPEAAETLAKAVAATMSTHIAAKEAQPSTNREIHDQLLELYRLAEAPDPPVGQIRGRLEKLPPPILADVEERARRLWPFWFYEPAPSSTTIGWLAHVPKERLLVILPSAISGGGAVVLGRARGSGRRSRPHFEPMIRGVVRGELALGGNPDAAPPNAGGRPRDDGAIELIAFLAMDWALATEQRPAPGRSEHKPFGDLVHQVFAWLELPDATGALRRYWREWARLTTAAAELSG
jgi:hypothetical protein